MNENETTKSVVTTVKNAAETVVFAYCAYTAVKGFALMGADAAAAIKNRINKNKIEA